MRVGIDAHVLGKRQTGNETYMRELLSSLAARKDPDVEYVCYHTARVPAVPSVMRRERLWPHSPLLRVPMSLPLALRRDRVDVAHLQYVSPPIVPCPIALVVHDLSFESHPEFLPRLQVARMRCLVPHSIRRSAHTIAVSRFTQRQIIERYRVRPDRVTVTPQAAGPAFRRIAERDVLRTKVAGLELPERYILAVGNLQPRKNLRTLLEAYASLIRAGRIEQRLVLVGQVHYRRSEER